MTPTRVPATATLAPTPTPTPTETAYPPEGYVLSRLTGLPVLEADAQKRPVAVVVNNLHKALPQSGIAQADIIYEVLAEAEITRLIAIFQSYDAPKIGPVRSARDYFVHFALDYDAIFVHHGGSPTGYTRLKNLGVNRLDGMNLEGITFWRDPVRAKIKGMLEHSSYTGAPEIKTAIANAGFRTDWQAETDYGYRFNNTPPDTLPDGWTAATGTITVPFSKSYPRYFTYDPDTRLYAVSNRDGATIDENTGEALAVTNIVIQYTQMRVVDSEGRRAVTTVGSGEGLLITNGGYVAVRWQKDSDTAPTRFTLADGTAMTLNPGKTWVCVQQESGKVVFDGA